MGNCCAKQKRPSIHDDTLGNTKSRANKNSQDFSDKDVPDFLIFGQATCGQATCQNTQVMQSKEEPGATCVRASQVCDPQESSDATICVQAVQVNEEPDLTAKKVVLHKLGFPRRPAFWPKYDEACHEAYALLPQTFGVRASFLAQFASAHLDVVRIQKYFQTFWLSSNAHDLKFAYPDDTIHVDSKTLDFWVFDSPGTPRIARAKVDQPKVRETVLELKLFEGSKIESIAYNYYASTDTFVAQLDQVAYFAQLHAHRRAVVDLRGRGSESFDLRGRFAVFQGVHNDNHVTSFYDVVADKWLATCTTPYHDVLCAHWSVRKNTLVVSTPTHETTMRQVDTFKDGHQTSCIVTEDQATQLLRQASTKQEPSK